MKSKIDFINGETTESLLKLFIPLMLAMTLTMAYSILDQPRTCMCPGIFHAYFHKDRTAGRK